MFVQIIIFIRIVVVVVVVVVNTNNNINNSNNNNNNNNNFHICYPVWLSTRRCRLQIRKEDHGTLICTCPAHTVDSRQDRILSSAK